MDARRDDVPNDNGAPGDGERPEVAVTDAVRPPLFTRLLPDFTLSPINARRWANFKANRRGYWSFIIFLGLCFVMLFAELIANDRPLIVRYNGRPSSRCWSIIRSRSSAGSWLSPTIAIRRSSTRSRRTAG